MKQLICVLFSVALLCQSCGKSEEHLRCEKAFKEYYAEHLMAAFVASAFGAADASAMNITSLEVSEYKVITELRAADSLNILRQKGEEKYQESLKMKTEWMDVCKKNYDEAIESYFRERKKAEEYMEAYNADSRRVARELYYEDMLQRPKRTVEELKEIYLKDPYSYYSRYVSAKKEIDDMVARKDEVIDNWFEETTRYKSMDADKVLGKCVEVTYYLNGNKNNKQKMLLVFDTNLSKVLGEM